MIQPHELRIGNLVQYPQADPRDCFEGEAGIVKVKSINPDMGGINGWHDMGTGGETKFEDLNGILLTEEWLLKFGFERFGDVGKVYSKELNRKERKLFYFNGLRAVRFYEKSNDKESWFDKGDIEFVHQLQNLYFALTGKELELKKEPA